MADCKVISVINWKGGVGKTTLTHHLGTGFYHLSDEERIKYLGTTELPRVLLIDNDAQCSLSVSCLGEKEYEDLFFIKKMGTISDLYLPFLQMEKPNINVASYILNWQVHRDKTGAYPMIDIFPAHQDLIYTDMDLVMSNAAGGYRAYMTSDPNLPKYQVLARILEQVRDIYDFIFIDCPPNLNYITHNALYVSDYYLIPTQLDFLSTYGLSSIITKVNDLNSMLSARVEGYKPTELIGIVANRVKEYNQEPKSSQFNILNRLYDSFGDIVFQNYVTDGDGITGASQIGYPVYALMNSSTVARKQTDAMLAVLCEMLERV